MPFPVMHAGLVTVGDALVLTEEEADLATSDTDVAGRHVGVIAEVAEQLGHEALAEPHHLGVRTPLRVEVGAALATTDVQASQRVLEDLLEPEELDDAEVHGRVESQAALVGPEHGVELDAEATVDLHLAAVVHPGTRNMICRSGSTRRSNDLRVHVLGASFEHRADRVEHLLRRLVELRLARVPSNDLVVDALHIAHQDGA